MEAVLLELGPDAQCRSEDALLAGYGRFREQLQQLGAPPLSHTQRAAPCLQHRREIFTPPVQRRLRDFPLEFDYSRDMSCRLMCCGDPKHLTSSVVVEAT